MPPLEVFVLRIAVGEHSQNQGVHGVLEIVRNDRQYTFHSLEGLVQLLQVELETARSGWPT